MKRRTVAGAASSGSVLAGVAAGTVESAFSRSSSRGLVVLVAIIAVAVLGTCLAAGEERLVVGALVLFCVAGALAFFGHVHTGSLIGAAVSGVLVLLAAELARWSGAGDGPVVCRRWPVTTAVSMALVTGCAGAAVGGLLVATRSAFAGLGLAAMAFGVLSAVAVVAIVLALSPGSARPEGGGRDSEHSSTPSAT